jgi:prepilin-type N-terminal cleavage/methylation domain-containing protein
MLSRTGSSQRLRRGGFTLIEVAITMLIIGIVGYIIVDAFVMTSRTMKLTERRSDVSASLQQAVERSVDELRSASSIVSAAPDSITVISKGSQLTISYDSTAKTVSSNNTEIATGVTSFVITYYNSSGAATTTVSAIKSAKIAIGGMRDTEPWTLESSVTFRKLH